MARSQFQRKRIKKAPEFGAFHTHNHIGAFSGLIEKENNSKTELKTPIYHLKINNKSSLFNLDLSLFFFHRPVFNFFIHFLTQSRAINIVFEFSGLADWSALDRFSFTVTLELKIINFFFPLRKMTTHNLIKTNLTYSNVRLNTTQSVSSYIVIIFVLFKFHITPSTKSASHIRFFFQSFQRANAFHLFGTFKDRKTFSHNNLRPGFQHV